VFVEYESGITVQNQTWYLDKEPAMKWEALMKDDGFGKVETIDGVSA
jgi:hypothetical protein